MHLNFLDPNIEIFSDFGVFIISLTAKNENLEITEILQKRRNTEI